MLRRLLQNEMNSLLIAFLAMNCANKCEKLSTFILIAQWFGDIIRGKRFYSLIHYGILHI